MAEARLSTSAKLAGAEQGGPSSPDFTRDVIQAQAETWGGLTPQQQNDVVDAFKQKHIYSQPGYEKLDDQQKLDVEVAFNQKHSLGTLQNVNPVDAGLTGFGLTAGTLTEPFTNAYTFGLVDNRGVEAKSAMQRFPGIQTDPGVLGNLYRFNQNPMAQLPGSLLGAFSNISGMAKALPTQWGNVARSVGSVLPYSGLSNTVSTFKGEQTPIEAASNTAIDTALAPLQLKGRISNTGLQGVGGYGSGFLSSVISDISNGRPVDIERAKQRALQEAALGAGTGLALGGHEKQQKKNGRYLDTAYGKFKLRAHRKSMTSVRKAPETQSFLENYGRQLQDAQSKTSLQGEKKAMQDQLRSLDQLYQNLQFQASRQTSQRQQFSREGQIPKEAQSASRTVETLYKKLRAEYETKYPSQKQQQKRQQIEKQKAEQAKKSRASTEKDARVARKKELDALKKDILHRDEKQRAEQKQLEAEVRNENAVEDSFRKQLEDQERANGKPVSEQKTKAKADPSAPEPQSAKDVKASLKKNKGKVVRLRYYAEKSGSDERSPFLVKEDIPVKLDVDLDGNDYVTVIDTNGQLTTRKIYDGPEDSRIESVEPTKKAPRYTYEDGKVYDFEGNEVVQDKKAGEKTSETIKRLEQVGKLAEKLSKPDGQPVGRIKKNVEKLEGIIKVLKSDTGNAKIENIPGNVKTKDLVKKNQVQIPPNAAKKAKLKEAITPTEVIEATKTLDDNRLEQIYDDRNPEIHKKMTGEDC